MYKLTTFVKRLYLFFSDDSISYKLRRFYTTLIKKNCVKCVLFSESNRECKRTTNEFLNV